MQRLVWQNSNGDEINLTSGNYGITNWEGFANTPLNIQSQQVPFQDGGVFLDALMEQRELSVTLKMQDNGKLETRYRMKRELIHILNPKLGEGYLIYTNDFISKRIKCVAQIPLFKTHNSNDSGTPEASLTWTACEPYWEDLEETSISISGINHIHYDGDVPASINLVIDEGTENPIITNRKTGKYIKLNDNVVAGRVTINTDLGKKSVIKENYIIKWIVGGSFRSGLFNDNKFIYAGDQIVAQDYASGKLLKTTNEAERVITKIRYYGGFYYVSALTDYMYRSSDLVNWQRFAVNNSIYSFCYNNGVFLVVGFRGIMKSTDLINWNNVFVPDVTPTSAEIEVVNNEFVCIMNNTAESDVVGFYKSQNGDNWEFIEIENEPEVDERKSLTYGNGIYVFSMSHKLYKSTDGINFEKIEDFDNFICKKCKFVNDNFVLIGYVPSSPYPSKLRLYNENMVYYNQVTLGRDGAIDIIYGNGIYGLCGDGGSILNSSNLVDWNRQSIPMLENRSIAYGNGILLACSSSIYKSIDGYKWVETKAHSNNLKVIYGNGVFVLYNNIEPKWVTVDGENFSPVDIGGGSGLGDMCYGGSEGKMKFVSVGDFGDSFISDDGRHWRFNQIIISGFDNIFYTTIVYGQGKFYAGSLNGLIIMSSNGIDWEFVTQVQNGVLKLIYNEDRNSFIMAIKENNITVLKETYNFVDWIKIAELPSDINNKIWYSKHQYIMFGAETPNVYVTSDLVNFRKLGNMTTSVFYDLVRYQDRYILAGGTIAEIIAEDKENVIAKLDSGSDMSLSLESGDNEILFYDDNNTSAMLTYRQKYIGV